ncbi:hypothetical protein SAMN02799632_03867 [Acinetobacter pittii]|nr:hypothetical protein [Acinetobacter pittii]EXE82568.1 hypothetical protein J588_3670 [Acinetobacter sp. 1578804]WPP93174.1 hypothetical protein SOI80_06050 [Acinetobacter pittii]SEP37344.1 hypothetical protein SAMN02799632_03867 [Acinetobacter pittii]
MSLKKLVSGMGLSIAMVVPAHAAQLNVIASGSFHGARISLFRCMKN